MYREIYLDVIFLGNLVMDYILLRLTCRVIRSSAKIWQSFLGAAAGALGSCVYLMLPADICRPAAILYQGILAAGMAWIGCRVKTGSMLVRAMMTLYLTAFLCGGFWDVLSKRREISPQIFLIFGLFTYLLLTGVCVGYEVCRTRIRNVYPVTLEQGKNRIFLCGLYDTGNQLEDSLSGKPVSVVDRKSLEKLLGEELTEFLEHVSETSGEEGSTKLPGLKPHFLTYQGVGRQGIMLAVTIENLFIHTPREVIQVPKPVVAISAEETALGGKYQMIINSKLIRT